MASTTNGSELKVGSTTTTPVPQNASYAGRPFRKFRRPNGREVHIAQTPEEQARLRKDLHPPEDFDVYIYGTDEHVSLLRRSERTRA
jgi:hypothetical protein